MRTEVGDGVSFPDAAMIFPECDIQLPMTLVLDRPVAHDRRCKTLCRELLAEDVGADVDAVLAIPHAHRR